MILYIEKRGEHDIGTYTHLSVLKQIYGEENVFQIDLLKTEEIRRKNYISFGYDGLKILPRMIRYFQGNCNFINNKIIDEILQIIKDRDIEFVFSEESDLGNLYKKIKTTFPSLKIICFFHDISAELFKIRIKDAPIWKMHYILECKKVIEQEGMAVKYVDEKWVFNEADAVRYRNNYHEDPSQIIQMGAPVPQCLDDEYKNKVTTQSEKKNLLFVCSKYYVNITGFKWFYENVIPHINKNFKVTVVGTGAQFLKKIINDPDIQILGKVDSMTQYYKNADIVIEPVFDGGGMKVKTIEALSFGKCIISTQESLNGYWERTPDDIRNKYICLCNTKEEWIDACNRLMGSEIHPYNKDVYDLFLVEFSDIALYNNMKSIL